ncbi:hypothetical protein B0J13DRAFT_562694 [Dactylonectria estremocensis]|uniref:Uncharacterized protein n=1 Tax=Dactylonectria estremocensis TaxID=1079267 RepID=A0A9P9IUN0_9HYPO|nr:hypothetical protein B0J13DRAFT_562694 [Dactylonectria estremocensis]
MKLTYCCSVGPDHSPTFDPEPSECETESAELCVLSTSYAVSVSGTVTSTTSTDIASTCGTVYGCAVEDSTRTDTTTSFTTPTSFAVGTTPIQLETWPTALGSEADMSAAAEWVQSQVESWVKNITATTTGQLSTTGAANSTTGGASSTTGAATTATGTEFTCLQALSGHDAVDSDNQDELAKEYSEREPPAGWTMKSDSVALIWFPQRDNVSYEYSINWYGGCEGPEQDIRWPLGEDNTEVRTYQIMRSLYEDCVDENDGVGGVIHYGCLIYYFRGGARS